MDIWWNKALQSAKNSNPKKFKTELCGNQNNRGFCWLGGSCNFAHSAAELVTRKESSIKNTEMDMTLSEYELIKMQKRRGLPLKIGEPRVVVEQQFGDGWKLISKKTSPQIYTQLGSNKKKGRGIMDEED